MIEERIDTLKEKIKVSASGEFRDGLVVALEIMEGLHNDA